MLFTLDIEYCTVGFPVTLAPALSTTFDPSKESPSCGAIKGYEEICAMFFFIYILSTL